MSVTRTLPVPSDIEIAQAAIVRPVAEIAARYGIGAEWLESYGTFKAKVDPAILAKLPTGQRAKYIDVTAITPTPLGEGKTTTTVGLTQGLGAHRARRPSRDPPALDGADLRHQGRGRRRRLQPDRADGRLQPPPHGRHPRRVGGAQPLRRGPRRAHVPRVPLVRRLLREARASRSSTSIPTRSRGAASWT